jgi:F-type H+-transporting ATPase subunit b
MHLDWSTLVLQVINLLILCWLLHRFLYRPILAVMDARRQLVEAQMSDAAKARDQAEDGAAQLAAERIALANDRAALLTKAAAEGEAQGKAKLAEAVTDAARLLEDARKAVEAEKLQALESAKAETLELAVDMATRLLSQAPAGVRSAAWLGLVTEHLTALPTSERDGLILQLAEGTPLRLSTAAALPPEAQGQWLAALKPLLTPDLTIDFTLDETLLGGAELHFPGAILRFSWKDSLDALRHHLDH